jgi:hypothetical protein
MTSTLTLLLCVPPTILLGWGMGQLIHERWAERRRERTPEPHPLRLVEVAAPAEPQRPVVPAVAPTRPRVLLLGTTRLGTSRPDIELGVASPSDAHTILELLRYDAVLVDLDSTDASVPRSLELRFPEMPLIVRSSSPDSWGRLALAPDAGPDRTDAVLDAALCAAEGRKLAM